MFWGIRFYILIRYLKKVCSKTDQGMFFDSRKTMPHLLTVAGLACCKSSVSKIIAIYGVSFMISPLVRHSFLLSSRTVFMLSIQTASTGPSKIIHLRFGESMLLNLRIIGGRMPSVHYLVSTSKMP